MPIPVFKWTRTAITDPLWQVKLLAALRSGDVAQIQPFLNDIKPPRKAGTTDISGFYPDEIAAVLLHFAIRGATCESTRFGVQLFCNSLFNLPTDETIELVLSNKYISPNLAHPPGSSFTAIHLASSLGRADVLKLLIEQEEADDTAVDDHGQSAADVAKDEHTLHVLRGRFFVRSYALVLTFEVRIPG